MGRKLLKTVQTITTFRNPLADPVGTRRGPPLVRGTQYENRWIKLTYVGFRANVKIASRIVSKDLQKRKVLSLE